MIVFATGVRPNLSFVLGSGIDIDQGILVDDFMRTNFSHIFAAGDVAQSRNFLTGQKTLNPILPEAVLHGKIAAINMAGGEASFRGNIPRNTFHFFDHFAFSIGLVDLDSRDFEVHVKNEPERHRYRKLIFRGDHLVGALGINETLDPGALLSIIVKGLGLDELKREFHAPYMNCSGWLRWIVEEKVGLGRSGGPL
jgi:phenylglyoxylate dehydrogenase epsilon subunit